MKYKKPALWTAMTAAVLCAVLAACTVADPLAGDLPEQTEKELPAIGDTVMLGRYEQDNRSSTGAEPIEWVVVDRNGQSLLLLSRYVLEHCPCDAEDVQAYTWKSSSLRTWLNGEFAVNAFTEEELAQLQWLDVDAESNPVSGLDAGTPTRDLVFVPSVQEMTRWFATDTQRAAQPTAYAAARGAYCGEGVQWWLRTPGSSTGNAAVVDVDGTLDTNGHLAWYPSVGVRPCIVLDASYGKAETQTADSFVELQSEAAGPNESQESRWESVLEENEVTVPVLDPVLAQQNIQSILATLRITEEHGISFGIPYLPPKAEDGTALFITLKTTYRLPDGSYAVQRPVDDATDWKAGDVMSVASAEPQGELLRITLRAAYRTPLGSNSWKELAASYVELSAPFAYNTAPILEEPSAGIAYRNGESLIHVNLQNGDRATLSLALPEDFVLAENWEKSLDPAMPPAIAVLQQDNVVGTLRLYPFATGDADRVDPAEDVLPMEIFAAVALSNHAGYEDYTVILSTDTGATATGKYVWQQLSGTIQQTDPAGLPWNSRDCVLAYDWSALHCYAELTLEEGLLSAQELEKIAHSIRWQTVG